MKEDIDSDWYQALAKIGICLFMYLCEYLEDLIDLKWEVILKINIVKQTFCMFHLGGISHQSFRYRRSNQIDLGILDSGQNVHKICNMRYRILGEYLIQPTTNEILIYSNYFIQSTTIGL